MSRNKFWVPGDPLDTVMAKTIVGWMRDNLVHAEGDLYGKPFEPPPWLVEAVESTYRFDPDTFRRLVDRVVVGLPKGSAKTEGAAAWAVTEFAGPVLAHPGVHTGEWPRMRQSPNVPIGAASYDQARLCFGAAAAMLSEGRLAPHFDVFENRIGFRDGRPGRLYRIAAEAGTNDGTLPTAFVADEVHEWVGRKARVHTVVGNSLRKRAGGLEINISTAGDPVGSELLHGLYEYGRKVNSGEVDDPAFLFIWREASTKWDLSKPDQLREATREAYGLAPWIDVDRVAQRFYQIPQHEYERYHLNRWVTGGDAYLPAGAWDKQFDPSRTVPDGEKIVLGFDGSYNHDSTCLYGCTLDGYVFKVGVWERPANALEWRVPESEVDAAVRAAFARWDVLEMNSDKYGWRAYIDQWVDAFGEDRVLVFEQNRARMGPATSKFYEAVMEGTVTHDGDPTLARHLRNAVTKPHPGGYMIVKDHPNRQIDAAVAAVMAFERATWRREAVPEPRVSFL